MGINTPSSIDSQPLDLEFAAGVDTMTVWQERAVLVTGATGLLGGWLVEALLARGAHVVALVRDRVPESRFFAEGIREQVVTVHGDVADQETMERVLGEHEIRTVFHLAAQTIVGIANRNPA